MSSSLHASTDAVFRIVGGAVPGPLVVDVSRSGTRYPPEFLLPAAFDILHTKISPYVDRIVVPSAAEGATILVAEFPPSFVDPNRPIDDIDPQVLDGEWPSPLNPLKASLQSGSGLIHTLGSNYAPLYGQKLAVDSVQRRIAGYYVPYHDALAELLSAKRREFGVAFQLSCHSMSSVGPRDGVKRPQICVGDLDGTTADAGYVEVVRNAFRERGFEVAMNKPFRGNELLRRHASPATGVHSVQVEMRRDLYIDEATRVLHDGLRVLQDCFVGIAAAARALT
jgi:N-formylglutamate amidohydrolase